MVPLDSDTIHIIDSIPATESQTARHIYDHIQDVQYDPNAARPAIVHHNAGSSDDLHAALAAIATAAETADDRPLIHIESHGDTTGLTLANGDFVQWSEIQPDFMRLNKATRNHLFIIVAACWGFHAIKAMLDKIDHGASFRILAGPAEETTSGRVEDALKAFYRALLMTGSIPDATRAALAHEPTFRVYSAEEAFIAGWKNAMSEYPITSKGIQKKAEQIITQMKSEGRALPARPHSTAKAAIRKLDLRVPFDAYKRKFFMLDLFPEVSAEVQEISLPKLDTRPSPKPV